MILVIQWGSAYTVEAQKIAKVNGIHQKKNVLLTQPSAGHFSCVVCFNAALAAV